MTCGTCSLCCKILDIDELGKPAGTWCEHCARPGCSQYAERAEICRTFECLWLQSQTRSDFNPMPEALRPDRCHAILTVHPKLSALIAHVDPTYPGAHNQGALGRFLDGVRLPLFITTGDKRAMRPAL